MKNTQILSVVLMSLLMALTVGNYTYAQEDLATQSSGDNSALAEAVKKAQAAQDVAKAANSTRGNQLSDYIDGLLNEYNKGTDDKTLLTALNDAATATPLLLGMEKTATAPRESTPVRSYAPVSTRSSVSTSSTMTLANDTEVIEHNDASVEEAKIETVSAEVKTPTVVTAVATTVSLEVQPKEQAPVVTQTAQEEAGPEVKATAGESTVLTAKAVVEMNNEDVAEEEAELPNTGETQNTVGKIIAVVVAAIIAGVGAVMIAMKMKEKNA